MNTISTPTEAPKPFLGRLFDDQVQPVIAAGYYYRAAEIEMHGVQAHRAIDFNIPRGTPILAVADGWYVATFGERLLREDDGQPIIISAKQAESVNNSSDLSYPSAKQPWCAYFGSYTIQGWHSQGCYTQYGHMDWVSETIPYFAPSERAGDLFFNPILRTRLIEYKTKAVFLKRGSILGYSGASGIGWNERSYNAAKLGVDNRPDFRGITYTHYDAPHLHFMVFGRRYGKKRLVKDFWDPFGVYGTADVYPQETIDWPKHPNSLWLS